ncbi:MAG: cupin domain-containing protein [Halanaerobiaceae bacterium]
MSRKILVAEGSMMMVEVHFEKGGIGEVHNHDEHEQICYVKEGSFKVEVGGEEKILKAGDSFYAGKKVDHGVKALKDSIILDIFTPIREDFLDNQE